jgi:hypothetical protein
MAYVQKDHANDKRLPQLEMLVKGLTERNGPALEVLTVARMDRPEFERHVLRVASETAPVTTTDEGVDMLRMALTDMNHQIDW